MAKMRSFLLLFLNPIVFIWLGGCMPGEKSTGPPFQTIVDGMGRTLKIPQHPSRVISLSPAITEMLFTLLNDSQIIGVSPNCNFPLQHE